MSEQSKGWPFPDQAGVPFESDIVKYHWIRLSGGTIHAAYWNTVEWNLGNEYLRPLEAGFAWEYITPCLTPSEISTIKKEEREVGYHAGYEDGCKVDAIYASVLYQSGVDEGRITEREKIASQVDCGCDIRDAVLDRLDEQGERKASWLCSRGDSCSALVAAIIRNHGRETIDE
jgi:hypothetical protein